MGSLVHQTAAAAAAAAAVGMVQCDDEFALPQSRFGCFGRSLSRASSGRRLDQYCRAVTVSEGEEMRRAAQERSARAKLRWKAVAREIMARRGGGTRRKQQQHGPAAGAAAAAFSYDSRSYALNFDQGADLCT